MLASQVAPAQTATETVLHDFSIFPNGAIPIGTLARDASGNLFGTTWEGGTANLGTVFEYSAAGAYKVLYSFQGGAARDGLNPTAAVALDPGDNVYGTTFTGGTNNLGVVFKVTPSGAETILHSFAGGADGSGPMPAWRWIRRATCTGRPTTAGRRTRE